MHPSVLDQGPAVLQSHQFRYSDSIIFSESLMIRRILLTQGGGVAPVADNYNSRYIHPSGSSSLSSSSASSSSIANTNHVNDPEQTRPNSPAYINNSSGFDINIVIITAAILFLLLSALAMNCVVKCMLRRCSCYGAFPAASHQESDHNNHHAHEAGMKKKEIKALPSIVYRDGARNSKYSSNHHKLLDHSHTGHGVDYHHGQQKDARGDEQEEEGSCPICLANFQDGDRVRVLPPCCHRFHMSCIDTWLAKHSSCPTCRGQLMHSMEVERPHVQLHILITTPGTTTTLAGPQGSHKDGSMLS